MVHVQEDGEDDAREGAALRPARPALANVLEAARRRRVAHVDVARLRAVGMMGPRQVHPGRAVRLRCLVLRKAVYFILVAPISGDGQTHRHRGL